MRTKINDKEALKKALDRMGLKYEVGDLNVTQAGTTEKVDIKLDDTVGFSRQKDGNFAIVGDPYYSENCNLSKYYRKSEQFQADVQTAYAIEESIDLLGEQQFNLAEQTEDEENVYLTFERF